MTELAEGLGVVLMIAGGLMVVTAIVGLLGWLACGAWIAFSNRFRLICRTESLIYEYLANREEYLAWKASKEDTP